MIAWFIFQRQRGDLQKKQALITKNEEIYRLEKILVEEESKRKALERQKIEAETENLKLQEAKARNYAQNLEDSNKELADKKAKFVAEKLIAHFKPEIIHKNDIFR